MTEGIYIALHQTVSCFVKAFQNTGEKPSRAQELLGADVTELWPTKQNGTVTLSQHSDFVPSKIGVGRSLGMMLS